MRKRTIQWIIGLLVLSLIGVVGLQFYWITQAMQLRETKFDEQVNEALAEVVKKVNRYKMARFISDKFQPITVSGVANVDSVLTHHLVTKDSSQSPKAVFITRMDTLMRSDSSIVWNEEVEVIDSVVNRVLKQDSVSSGYSKHIVLKSYVDTGTAEEEEIAIVSDQMNNVMRQMVVEFVSKDVSLQEQLNLLSLDSLIRATLNDQGVNLAFSYDIQLGDSVLLAQADTLPFRSYSIGLFPHNVRPTSDLLRLYFPERKAYVRKSMWWLFTGSGVFTLIILLTFFITIRTLLRQKKLSDIKTDFINNMTHEFKTPIATIAVAVDALANKQVQQNAEQQSYYQTMIKDENQRMNQQVERVLQMSLLENADFDLHKKSVDLHQLLQEAIRPFQLLIERRQGQLTFTPAAKSYHISGDPIHLTNAITNLLDNANKYSPEVPAIEVSTSNVSGGIVLTIQDQGLGMSTEEQKHIFERFYRVPTGNIHNVKGFGLGLNYVQSIVDAHDGTIQVSSTEGQGSTFTLFFPIYNHE